MKINFLLRNELPQKNLTGDKPCSDTAGEILLFLALPDFFLENMVTQDQHPMQIYESLLEDGYKVQEPDLLHKMHPKFWNNTPMLKYLCHVAIYKNRNKLSHFKEKLPKVLANSVDDFIRVKDWDNEL